MAYRHSSYPARTTRATVRYLEVSEGHIVRYVPRQDEEVAVTKVVDQAWPNQPDEWVNAEREGFGTSAIHAWD